jgi:hypothetical protein
MRGEGKADYIWDEDGRGTGIGEEHGWEVRGGRGRENAEGQGGWEGRRGREKGNEEEKGEKEIGKGEKGTAVNVAFSPSQK